MGENLNLDFVLEYKIKALLEEYFYSDEALEIIAPFLSTS